jgi:DNA polymerase-3 subunit gamma/tau
MSTTVLARKWRPRTFEQLTGQEHVVRALTNALAQNRLHHAYLFTGTRGVGKTTIARIFAKSLNCETGVTAAPCGVCAACREIDSGRFVDLVELDAASNTQVDNMRELLESALYAPTSGRFKVYIIDEVHMLSKSAFNAMLKTLEEPPAHVKFILATTDPQKIPVTVLSRCLQFNLKQLPPPLILSRLRHVLEQEGITAEQGALTILSRAAQGSMRDALSLLDQAIAYGQGKVEEGQVRAMLGAIDHGYLHDMLDALLARDGAALLKIADGMQGRSMDFEGALQELAALLHRIALAQAVPQAIPEDEPEHKRLLAFASQIAPEDLQLYYQIAIHGRDEIDLAPDEYAGFTMTLLRMLSFAPGWGQPGAGRTAPRLATGGQAAPAQSPATVRQAVRAEPEAAGSSGLQVAAGALDWNVLLAQLAVQGTARELAKNCTLESFDGTCVKLNLAPQHKLLNSKMAQEKLQAALAEYFAKPVKLAVALGLGAAATPAAVEQQEKQTRQQLAEEAIAQDPFVREAQAVFGAQVIEDSIKPIEQENAR